MKHKLYHIDAFTNALFRGNSACIVVLSGELSDDTLLKVASENAVAETAFLLSRGDRLQLRWFTPDLEMDLCGHATLAAAYVVFHFMPEYIQDERVVFDTCEGALEVTRSKRDRLPDLFCLNFPLRQGLACALPKELKSCLSIQPQEVYRARDYHLVYRSPEEILALEIDRKEFDKIDLDTGGVAVSARGPLPRERGYEEISVCDFVSRFFTPQATILEDPVTGSAYCTMAPYWAARLNKTELFSKQISARCGEISCTLIPGRVLIKGCGVCYLEGEITIDDSL